MVQKVYGGIVVNVYLYFGCACFFFKLEQRKRITHLGWADAFGDRRQCAKGYFQAYQIYMYVHLYAYKIVFL